MFDNDILFKFFSIYLKYNTSWDFDRWGLYILKYWKCFWNFMPFFGCISEAPHIQLSTLFYVVTTTRSCICDNILISLNVLKEGRVVTRFIKCYIWTRNKNQGSNKISNPLSPPPQRWNRVRTSGRWITRVSGHLVVSTSASRLSLGL